MTNRLSLASIVPWNRRKAAAAPGDQGWLSEVAPHRRNLVYSAGGMRAVAQRLHYIDAGSGEPVVLIHGYADSTYSWHRTLPALVAAGARVVALDLPALGRSTVPPRSCRLTVDHQAGAVLRLLDALGLQRAHLVGHSMGAGIVLYLCVTRPERVDRAAAIAPVWRRPRRRMLLSYPGARHAAALAGRHVFARSLRDVYRDRSLVTDALIDEYARPAAQRADFWPAVARLTREFFSSEFDTMTEQLGQIRSPVLLLWGEHDTWVKPRPELAERIPGARYVPIAGAGHNVHQERADEVNAQLRAFLTEKTAR